VTKQLLLLGLAAILAACDGQQPVAPNSFSSVEVASQTANAKSLFRVESPMFPFYARAEPPADVGGFAYHDDNWAAIVFYRDPSCIPTDFNLFQFYDFNFGDVFGCTSLVDGFSLHVEPDGVTPPKVSNLSGTAVAIWFVPWDEEFQQAVEAEALTVSQLENMDGLVKGVATHFRETLGSVEFHPVPKINITARGYILPESGGGSFNYVVNWPGLTVDEVRNVNIVIRQ
jgi:hypothetical protein